MEGWKSTKTLSKMKCSLGFNIGEEAFKFEFVQAVFNHAFVPLSICVYVCGIHGFTFLSLLLSFCYFISSLYSYEKYLPICSIWLGRTSQTKTSIICMNFMTSWPMHTMIQLWCEWNILKGLIVTDLHFFIVLNSS